MNDTYQIQPKRSSTRQEKSKFWEQMVSDQKASGMKMKRFCREHRLAYYTFKTWKHRLKNIVGMDNLKVADENACKRNEVASQFIPLQIISEKAPIDEKVKNCEIKICFKNGHSVAMQLSDLDTMFLTIKKVAGLPC